MERKQNRLNIPHELASDGASKVVQVPFPERVCSNGGHRESLQALWTSPTSIHRTVANAAAGVCREDGSSMESYTRLVAIALLQHAREWQAHNIRQQHWEASCTRGRPPTATNPAHTLG